MTTGLIVAEQHLREQDGPEQLLAFSEEQFYKFVDQDVRGKLPPKLSALLRDPVISERWYLVLVRMKKNVESTLAATHADLRSKRLRTLARIEELDEEKDRKRIAELRAMIHKAAAEYEEIKAKRIRFRSAVEDAIQDARWYRFQQGRVEVAEQRQVMANELATLRGAVRRHHESIDDEDADDADIELWRVIDG